MEKTKSVYDFITNSAETLGFEISFGYQYNFLNWFKGQNLRSPYMALSFCDTQSFQGALSVAANGRLGISGGLKLAKGKIIIDLGINTELFKEIAPYAGLRFKI